MPTALPHTLFFGFTATQPLDISGYGHLSHYTAVLMATACMPTACKRLLMFPWDALAIEMLLLTAGLWCACVQVPEREHDAPKVSPYRLAAHLASAFSIYAVLLWSSLSLMSPIPQLTAAAPVVQANAGRLRRIAVPLSLLIAVTAASGKH